MTTLYAFALEPGICRTFTSEAVLSRWLNNERRNQESPEAFSAWLANYFDQGNEISVRGEHYEFWDCLELI